MAQAAPKAQVIVTHGKRCVTITEAARLKGCTKEAIRNAVRLGILKEPIKLGARLHLIPLDDLEHYTPNPNLVGPDGPRRPGRLLKLPTRKRKPRR